MWQPVLAAVDERDAGLGRIRVLDVRRPAAAAVELAASDEPLVLVGHSSTAVRLRVLATYVAAHQPTRPVAHVTTHHAPLAAAVALDHAVSLTDDPGHAVAAWRDLLEHTWSGAVVGSVTRLSRPNPTMTQHIRSWWPSSSFVVQQGDDPRSVPASHLQDLLAELPRRTLEAFVTTAADHPVVRDAVAQVAPTAVRTVDGLAGWRGVYGVAEQLQLALVPADPASVVRDPGGACSGCGFHADEVCVFCRTRARDEPRDRRPSEPRPLGESA